MLTKLAEYTSFVALRDSLNEVINDELNPLLSSIHAKRVELRGVSASDTLDSLCDSVVFDEALRSRKLRHGKQINTEDFQVFSKFKLKLLPIYKERDLDIADPVYLLLQEETDAGWSGVQAYAVNGNIVKLYDALSARTVELKSDGKTYIYETSNSGKNWMLKGVQQGNVFRLEMTTPDIKKLVKDKGATLNIIG